MDTRTEQEMRQSMWSVSPALVPFYFALFTVSVLAGIGFVVWYEVAYITVGSTPDTMIGIIQGVGWVGLSSAIGTFTLTEVLENTMVMANWFRQHYLEPLKERQRQEGREKGLQEGREEGRELGLEEGREEGLHEGRAVGLLEGREEGEREALARVRAEMEKRGIELSEEDEDALFNRNGHSQ